MLPDAGRRGYSITAGLELRGEGEDEEGEKRRKKSKVFPSTGSESDERCGRGSGRSRLSSPASFSQTSKLNRRPSVESCRAAVNLCAQFLGVIMVLADCSCLSRGWGWGVGGLWGGSSLRSSEHLRPVAASTS